jgi:hypothetical protein
MSAAIVVVPVISVLAAKSLKRIQSVAPIAERRMRMLGAMYIAIVVAGILSTDAA